MTTIEENPFDSGGSENDEEKLKELPPKYEPEPMEQGLLVKPFCECSSCHHLTHSADWSTPPDFDCESKTAKKPEIEKIVKPITKSEKYPGKKIVNMSTYDSTRMSKVQKQTISKTLVQGEIIPEPIEKLKDTYFSEYIQKSLKALNYQYSLPIQSFIWPAIFRELNVCMIGPSKSGKTLAYLPAMSTFCDRTEPKYQELSKQKGPLVIILCPNSKQCEEIMDLIDKLHSTIFPKPKDLPKVFMMTYPITNIHEFDILITMPESLELCLKNRMFTFKRLCHLVLEDINGLLRKNGECINKIINLANEMLEHRHCNIPVQLIATSEKWTNNLKEFFNSLYVTPLVCIDDYLEAALYGNIQFKVKFLKLEKKLAHIKDLLKDKYHLHKSLIICDGSEGAKINDFMRYHKIKTFYLSDNVSSEEIEAFEMEWALTPGSQFKVLICSDFILESMLNINDIMWIIHYSFPKSWSMFTRRFNCLSSNFTSPFNTSQSKVQSKSFILIDQTCEKQMPKVLNFLGRVAKKMPASYEEYIGDLKHKTELNKIKNNVKLCPTLKLFGKCSISLCANRHTIDPDSDISNDLPKSGKVTFKIINMTDVTHCTVQLIEHTDLNEATSKINSDDLKQPLIYKPDELKKPAENISIGKFYAHCDHTTEGQVYSLCHVLKIEKNGIDVKLMDQLTLQTREEKLFEIPSGLKIVDVILCNLMPPFKDSTFSGRSLYVARSGLEKKKYKNIVFTGTILLQMDGTLWLDNVAEMFKIEETEVIKFDLMKFLRKMHVVEPCVNQIAHLHKLCNECNVTLPTYVKKVSRKVVKAKEPEPMAAFLDDNVHEVVLSSAVSPEEFYVRLVKFESLLENLEKDIQISVKTEIPDKKMKIEIGKHYLAPDPKGETYSRVKVLNAEESKVLVFYVDYGDEGIVDINTIKFLPTKFITRLPFQAIQCRLFGLTADFDNWDDETTDILYDYMFEPESDIFRSLFVYAQATDTGDVIRCKKKFSVLLKDGYGEEKVLINQLFLDKGLATSVFEKFDDFEVPLPKVVDVDSESDKEIVEENVDYDEEIKKIMEDDFDLEINNALEFLKFLGIARPAPPVPQISEEFKDNQDVEIQRMIEAPPPSGYSNDLTPELIWSQTDELIRLKIQLIGVDQYKTNVVHKKIFSFSTNLNEKQYKLNFTLHKPVVLQSHRACGQEVLIVLKKIESVEWLQLTGTKHRLRYIHYDLPGTKDELPKRKFLQLDITDDESDDDGFVYEISDRDSEYDGEIPSSSGDD